MVLRSSSPLIAVFATICISSVLCCRPTAGPQRGYEVGDHVTVPGLTHSEVDRTLLLVLSPTCDSCVRNLSLYRRIRQRRDRSIAGARLFKFVIVGIGDTSETRAYLSRSRLQPDELIDVNERDVPTLSATGIPALILLDERGDAKSIWPGPLDVKREVGFLSTLFPGS